MLSIGKQWTDILDVTTRSNKYGMAISQDAATAVRFTSDFALSTHRITHGVTPEEVFETNLLHDIDPSLVTWTPGRIH